MIYRVSVDTKYSGDPHDPSPSCWNWNRFGRNLGDLLYLMNEESVLKPSALHPPPQYMIQQESHKGRLIETSGKMPTRNPADKVHYIVRFRDWRLAHSVILALNVPKTGSGELENRQTSVGIPAFLLLSGPIRKRIQYLFSWSWISE